MRPFLSAPADTAAPGPSRNQAISLLRSALPPGSTVLTTETYRRRSHQGQTWTAFELRTALGADVSQLAAQATGNRYVQTSTHSGVRGNFGGLSPHQQLVQELSQALYNKQAIALANRPGEPVPARSAGTGLYVLPEFREESQVRRPPVPRGPRHQVPPASFPHFPRVLPVPHTSSTSIPAAPGRRSPCPGRCPGPATARPRGNPCSNLLPWRAPVPERSQDFSQHHPLGPSCLTALSAKHNPCPDQDVPCRPALILAGPLN
jgi:hypothetical protein